jgi:hypothetical protein
VGADRGEVPKGSAEIFFRKVKFWNDDEAEEAPPVFVRICSLLLISYSDCKFRRTWKGTRGFFSCVCEIVG